VCRARPTLSCAVTRSSRQRAATRLQRHHISRLQLSFLCALPVRRHRLLDALFLPITAQTQANKLCATTWRFAVRKTFAQDEQAEQVVTVKPSQQPPKAWDE